MIFRWLVIAITVGGAVGCVTFVVRYWIATRGAWMKSEAGRFMMMFQANLGFLFLLIIANSTFGNWPGRQVVTLALYVTYAVQTWWPSRLLIRANELARDLARRREQID